MTLFVQVLQNASITPDQPDAATRSSLALVSGGLVEQAQAVPSPALTVSETPGAAEVATSGASLAFEKVLVALAPLHGDGSAVTWERALRELASAFPGSQGLWVEHSDGTFKPRKAFTSEKFAAAYQAGFHLLDPLAHDDCVGQMAAQMEPFRIEEAVELKKFERGAFAWNFLAGLGVLGHGLGVCIPVGPGRISRLWLFRPRERPFQDYEVRALAQFGRQAGHILVNHAEREHAVSQRAEAAALLDDLSIPCFIVDQDAKLLLANASAKRLVRRGGPLVLRNELLSAAIPADDEHATTDVMAAMLERLRGESGRHSRCDGFAAASLSDASGESRRWFAFATRLRSSRRSAGLRFAITVTDARHPGVVLSEDQMRQLFGFTPTESRIAQALLIGETTDAIATAMMVRCDTVRCHIKALLAKTGSRSHTELQKLLLRIAPGFDPG